MEIAASKVIEYWMNEIINKKDSLRIEMGCYLICAFKTYH